MAKVCILLKSIVRVLCQWIVLLERPTSVPLTKRTDWDSLPYSFRGEWLEAQGFEKDSGGYFEPVSKTEWESIPYSHVIGTWYPPLGDSQQEIEPKRKLYLVRS